MSGNWLLPPGEAVSHLLRDLLGRQVTSKKIAGPLPAGPLVAATFIRDDGLFSALCAVDLQLAANLGAALTMAPAAIANEAVKAKKLDELLSENVREVLNIGSRWFMPEEEAPHVKLKDVLLDPLPKEVLAMIKLAPRQRFVEVEIAGYKGGKLGLFSR